MCGLYYRLQNLDSACQVWIQESRLQAQTPKSRIQVQKSRSELQTEIWSPTPDSKSRLKVGTLDSQVWIPDSMQVQTESLASRPSNVDTQSGPQVQTPESNSELYTRMSRLQTPK